MSALSPARRISDVSAKPVQWLWPRRFALGKLSLICGDPGVGKSFLTCYVSACVSRGLALPDGGKAPCGSVVLLSAEDGLEDTIRPRLDAAHADTDKIVALSSVHNLRRDVPVVEQAVGSLGDCKLVVIDPISAYMNGVDSHKNAEVRSVLAPLSAMAERNGVAVVIVQHLNKNESLSDVHRVSGSVAFAAAARNVWQVAKHGEQRVMRSLKDNVGASDLELAYRITGGRVVWERSQADTTTLAKQALRVEGYTDEEIEMIFGRGTE